MPGVPRNEVIEYDDAIVAFVDILGFRSMVRSDSEKNPIARRLDKAMEKALENFGGRAALLGTKDAEWRVRVFSDCISVAKPLSVVGLISTLEALSAFMRSMILDGFFVRGGAALGPYFETAQLLFSKAQIEAYELESQVAKFPRIVVSEDLYRYIGDVKDDDMRLLAKEYLVQDASETRFVNYLVFEDEDAWEYGHRFYLSQKQAVAAALADDLPEDVRLKFEWVSRYHDWSLRLAAEILKRTGTLCEDTMWSFSSLIIDRTPGQREFRSAITDDPVFDLRHDVSDPRNPKYQPYPEEWERKYGNREIDWILESPFSHREDDEDSDGV